MENDYFKGHSAPNMQVELLVKAVLDGEEAMMSLTELSDNCLGNMASAIAEGDTLSFEMWEAYYNETQNVIYALQEFSGEEIRQILQATREDYLINRGSLEVEKSINKVVMRIPGDIAARFNTVGTSVIRHS